MEEIHTFLAGEQLGCYLIVILSKLLDIKHVVFSDGDEDEAEMTSTKVSYKM